MTNLRTIDSLFEQWKESHKNEKIDSYIKTAPMDKNGNSPDYNMFKGSFCPDGYLGDSKESYILFICKESNVNGIVSDGSFWLREVVQTRLKGEKYRDVKYNSMKEKKRDRIAQTKYFNCLNTIARILLNDLESENVLQKCGYMNINKRGGYSSCNFKQLKNYAEVYDDKIFRQIQVLNPRKIVLLGVSLDIFSYNVKRYLKDVEKYTYSRHPSRYRSLEKHGRDLCKINWDGIL